MCLILVTVYKSLSAIVSGHIEEEEELVTEAVHVMIYIESASKTIRIMPYKRGYFAR